MMLHKVDDASSLTSSSSSVQLSIAKDILALNFNVNKSNSLKAKP